MATLDQLRVHVRDVTNEEFEFFFERGWVHLPRLVDRDTVAHMLEVAKARLGEAAWDWDPIANTISGVSTTDFKPYRRIGPEMIFNAYWRIADEDPYFNAVRSAMGRNAAKLLGDDNMAVRASMDNLAVKLPVNNRSSHGVGTQATGFHQDHVGFMIRGGFIHPWLALDDLQPEQGVLRFYERSHQFGLIGPGDPTEVPWVEKLPLSPPLHLEPGDATVHHSLTLHGAPENTTDRPRWAWIMGYIPADAVFVGAKSPVTDELFERGEIEVGKPLDHPNFPVVYAPADWTPGASVETGVSRPPTRLRN